MPCCVSARQSGGECDVSTRCFLGSSSESIDPSFRTMFAHRTQPWPRFRNWKFFGLEKTKREGTYGSDCVSGPCICRARVRFQIYGPGQVGPRWGAAVSSHDTSTLRCDHVCRQPMDLVHRSHLPACLLEAAWKFSYMNPFDSVIPTLPSRSTHLATAPPPPPPSPLLRY